MITLSLSHFENFKRSFNFWLCGLYFPAPKMLMLILISEPTKSSGRENVILTFKIKVSANAIQILISQKLYIPGVEFDMYTNINNLRNKCDIAPLFSQAKVGVRTKPHTDKTPRDKTPQYNLCYIMYIICVYIIKYKVMMIIN